MTEQTRRTKSRRLVVHPVVAAKVHLTMCLLGLVFVLCSVPQYWRIHGSTAWPTVTAVIRASEVCTGQHRRTPYFIPRIGYRYTVQGVEFTGSALSLAKLEPRFRGRKNAENVLLAYPVGSELKVHYDPAKPWDSVVEPGLSDEQRVLVWIACVLTVFFGTAALVLFFTLRKAEQKSGHSVKPS